MSNFAIGVKNALKSVGDRINHPNSFIAFASEIVIIANLFGAKIDTAWANNVILSLASLGIAFGILNNPKGNTAFYNPFSNSSNGLENIEKVSEVFDGADQTEEAVKKDEASNVDTNE